MFLLLLLIFRIINLLLTNFDVTRRCRLCNLKVLNHNFSKVMTGLPVISPIAKFLNESSLEIWISHHAGH